MAKGNASGAVRVGVYINPWNESRLGMLAGLASFQREHPRWSFYLPTPAWMEWMRPPPNELDGVIMCVGTWMDPAMEFASHLPRIVIGNCNQDKFDLAWDNHAIGHTAAEHLMEQGHRSLACIRLNIGGTVFQQERAAGFLETVAERGLSGRSITLPDADDDEQCLQAIRALPAPTGLMLTTDRLANRFLDLAYRAKIDVPEHLAVVGVGDNPLYCELSTPQLSSVALPGDEMGYQAGGLLERRLRGEPRPDTPLLIAPGYVAVRQSSELLAINHPQVARALRRIRQSPDLSLTVRDVHEAAGMSRRSLEIAFKREVGRTISEEICRLRIERAKRLLEETDLPLKTVAARAGFETPQRLSTIFARHTGTTPSAFRRGRRRTPHA